MRDEHTSSFDNFISAFLRFTSGFAGVALIPAVIYFARLLVTGDFGIVTVPWFLCPVMASGLFIWYALRGQIAIDRELIRSGWQWGFMVAVGGLILGGFIFPLFIMVVTGTDPSQAPLIGIFLTGPAGFSIGVITGIVIGLRRQGHWSVRT